MYSDITTEDNMHALKPAFIPLRYSLLTYFNLIRAGCGINIFEHDSEADVCALLGQLGLTLLALSIDKNNTGSIRTSYDLNLYRL